MTARMRGLTLALMAGAALASGTVAEAKPRPTGEERLAEILKGRVAGEPVDCITLHNTWGTQIVDKTAIVYDAGSTLYVQRPRVGAESLDSNAILVTRLTGPQLCSVDTIQLVDRNVGFWRGFVGLEKFVPYRKPPKASAAR